MKQAIIAGLGAAIAISVLTLAELTSHQLFLMAPFGATCVLIFALPDSPLAAPKNVILGHMIASVVGLLMLNYFAGAPWAAALAVGITVALMVQFNSVHPPAGANPLLLFALQPSADFLIFPVLTGAIALVLVGIAYRWLLKLGLRTLGGASQQTNS